MRMLIEGEGKLQRGLQRWFTGCRYECTLWNPQTKPAFDIFDEVEPDIYFHVSSHSRAVAKCVAEHEVRCQPIEDAPLVDTYEYFEGKADESLKCDVAFVGSNQDLRAYRLLCKLAAESSLHLKIFSGDSWPLVQTLGQASLETQRNVYKSAHLSFAASRQHSYEISASEGYALNVFETGYEVQDIVSLIEGFKKSDGAKNRRKLIEAAYGNARQNSYAAYGIALIDELGLLTGRGYPVNQDRKKVSGALLGV